MRGGNSAVDLNGVAWHRSIMPGTEAFHGKSI